MNTQRRAVVQWTLIGVVVAGLVLDAIVHFDLASAFKNNKTSVLSETDIFRAQSTIALLAAAALVLRPRRYTAAIAFLVAASAAVAVVVYRYVNVGEIGPLPNMYDPYWQPAGKYLSAIAEVVAAIASAVLFGLLSTRSSGDSTGRSRVDARVPVREAGRQA